jgi:hypothetical protein
MAVVTLRARGQTSPELAWQRYDELALWSTWAPQIQRVVASTDRLAPGTTGTVHAGLLPRPTLPVPFEVLDVDRDARRWSWRVRLGPLRLDLEHGVDAEGTGSSTYLRVDGPAPVVLVYAPLARLALSRLVA